MSPILPKSDAADLVVAARIRRGLSWSQIAERIGVGDVEHRCGMGQRPTVLDHRSGQP